MAGSQSRVGPDANVIPTVRLLTIEAVRSAISRLSGPDGPSITESHYSILARSIFLGAVERHPTTWYSGSGRFVDVRRNPEILDNS
jgi:hypothetical protein